MTQYETIKVYLARTYFAAATPAGPMKGGWQVFKVHYYVHAYHHR